MKHYSFKHLHKKSSGSRLVVPFNVKSFLVRRRIARDEESQLVNIPVRPKFVSRLVYPKKDPKASQWWEYVLGGTRADPLSRDGKTFRSRFRTTHEFFLNLVVQAKELFPNLTLDF